MPGPDDNEILRPSLIDRFGETDRGFGERLFFEGIGVRELKTMVARDLERLLNTRVWLPPEALAHGELDEARRSLIAYGLPDLSRFSWTNPQDCKEIAGLVEEAIRAFEPRLLPSSVHCEIVPGDDVSDFSVKLRIDAILHVDPISEQVTFDSEADFENGGLRIESFE